jgi:hypothetical protein
MEHAERVFVAGMLRARPHAGHESQLLDSVQPQECRRLHQGQFRARQVDQVVEGIADLPARQPAGIVSLAVCGSIGHSAFPVLIVRCHTRSGYDARGIARTRANSGIGM